LSRASYNTTMMVYPYPTGGVWGTPVAGPFDCRLVGQTQLLMDGWFLDECHDWVTTDFDLGDFSFIWTPGDEDITADLTGLWGLAIPHTALPSWIVVQRLTAVPWDGPEYFRYYLRPTDF